MYVVFAAVVASVGGVLFGYDIGITSGALLQLKDHFHLTYFEQEMVVSSVLIGAFCASFFGGNIVDSWGRKVGISISCFLFIVGALILSLSVNFIMLIVGRIIVGIAVSLSVTSECTYISEISPPSRRGMMVSLNEVGITVGFLLAYLVNYLFITTDGGWKYMFGAAAILALIQALGVTLMPNSHHYLLIKGHTEEARKVLRSLRNSNDVEEEIEAIMFSIEEQKGRKYVDLFSTSSNMRSRMCLGMILVLLQQFSGNANVLYYAPTVFQHFGYESNSIATLVTVGLGIIKVFSTAVTLLIVDKVGRRTLLLTGCILMATSIMILGIVGTVSKAETIHKTCNDLLIQNHHRIIHHISCNETAFNISFRTMKLIDNVTYIRSLDLEGTNQQITAQATLKREINLQYYDLLQENGNISVRDQYDLNKMTPFSEVKSGETGEMFSILQLNNYSVDTSPTIFKNLNTTSNLEADENISEVPMAIKITSVVSLMVFVCAYGMSYGPVTWLILSEIFPGSLRGRAISVATCINWGSNIIVSLTFLDILNAVSIGPTFMGYGVISYGAVIFVFMCVPETKNKTLEEIDGILKHGFLKKNMRICSSVPNQQKYSVERMNSTIVPN